MMNNLRRLRATVLIMLASCLALPAVADDSALPIWQLNGEKNTIYLLGSIHLLREKDHPLPAAMYTVYNDAEKLIFELDMDDIDPVASQMLATELGLIAEGGTLQELLGPDTYARAEALAATANIPLNLLTRAEPWYAAMNVELMLLMRMGFNPELGIESHFMERAKADRKEILGLETMRQQLEFLDHLSMSAQTAMFLQSLEDGPEMSAVMDALVDAWRSGDAAFMEDEMLADMQEHTELNEAIVINRNIDWTAQIEKLLSHDDDYLIIVGALHLVGEDGVPAMLGARGHDVWQLRN